MTEENLERIQGVLDFANRPENYFHPGRDPLPGDREEYTTHLGDFRVVFSITTTQGAFYRHISISLADSLPKPREVFRICQLYGFTGWEGFMPPDDWVCKLESGPNVVTVVQEIFS